MNKDLMKTSGLFDVEMEFVAHNFCPRCRKAIDLLKFRDTLSLKEYNISGLCQSCQDDIFEEPEDPGYEDEF